MKNIAILVTTMVTAVSAFGQGQVVFNNRVVGSVVAPIYGVNPAAPDVRMSGNASTNGGSVNYTGVPLLSGTGFSAALYAAATAGGINEGGVADTALSTVPFRTTAATAGFIANPVSAVTIPGVTTTQPWSFQVRAWDNQNGTLTTWAAVLGSPTAARGWSDVFTTTVNFSPTPAGNLVGLTSFNLITPVPEPSLIALGALGLGALLLRRRKA